MTILRQNNHYGRPSLGTETRRRLPVMMLAVVDAFAKRYYSLILIYVLWRCTAMTTNGDFSPRWQWFQAQYGHFTDDYYPPSEA
jgi:hypothetical protein